jgi:site-specific DNA recombinase
LAQSGSIEGILILSPDRLSRKQANQIILMEEFKKRNIQVIFTNQNFSDSPEDNLMLQIQGAIAEYERTKILDRMRRGIIHAVKKGQILGNNPPYGYTYIPKSKTSVGYWEVNPDEAKIVRLIYEWYVNEKMKGRAIAKRLNDEAIECRTVKWWSSQIYSILKSETYTGTAYMFQNRRVESRKTPKSKPYSRYKNTGKAKRSRDEWIGIPVTPIIDNETWNKAQALLKQNAYRARRHNNKHEYLLRGLVACGLCGCMVSGYVSNKSTYYSCGARRNKHTLIKQHEELIQTRHQPFDEKVWAGLQELLDNPENLKVQLEKRLQAKKAKLLPSEPTNEFDKELKQLVMQEKRILDAYRQEIIDLSDLKEQKEQIAKRRRVLEGKKKAVLSHTEGSGQPLITIDMLGDVSARFQRVMTKANFATREKLVNRLVNSVTLYSHKAVVRGTIPLVTDDALIPARQSRTVFVSSRNFIIEPGELVLLEHVASRYQRSLCLLFYGHRSASC